MVDIRQTARYGRYLEKIGWTVERINGVNYFIRNLPLIGSLMKIQRPEKIDNNSIIQLSKKYRAFQIVIEPKTMTDGQWLMANGYKRSRSPFLPSKTLCLDLTKSKEKLFAGLKKDCRQAIKKTKYFDGKAGYSLSTSYPLEEFRKVWKRAVGWKRYVPPLDHLNALKEAFGNNCLFLGTGLPRRSAGAEAGAIFLIGNKAGYYWQAFTDSKGRKAQVQYKIVWEGIFWAKKKGAKVFDFEGIYDPRFPNKSWLGFTHFKKSFGGYEVEYPGAFVKNLLPFKLCSILRSNFW